MDISIYPELFDFNVRRALLQYLNMHLEEGCKDPALFYLGARFACSLALEDETNRWVKKFTEVYGNNEKLLSPFKVLLVLVKSELSEKKAILEKIYSDTIAQDEPYKLLLKDFYTPEGSINLESTGGIPYPELPEINSEILHDSDKLFRTLSLNGLVQEIKKGLKPDKVLADIREEIKDLNEYQQLQYLSALATDAYESSYSTTARLALERMLLIDGKQPEVLRNLITIASEQMDFEGYERYWKRYITLLLWNILTDNEKEQSFKDLYSFYIKVAGAIEQVCSRKDVHINEYLAKKGFLSRWLEANSALIWLTSIYNLNLQGQTNLRLSEIQAGKKGNLDLIEYWFSVFYPEFGRYFKSQPCINSFTINLPAIRKKRMLTHDPALTIVKRFLQWSRHNYGITQRDDIKGMDTVSAFAAIVCHIPLKPLVPVLTRKIRDDERNEEADELKLLQKEILVNESITAWIKTCCRLPFINKFNGCFSENSEPKWDILRFFFGNDLIRRYLENDITVYFYLNRAFMEGKDLFNSLKILSELVSFISPDDKLGDTQMTDLIEQAFNDWLTVFMHRKPEILGMLQKNLRAESTTYRLVDPNKIVPVTVIHTANKIAANNSARENDWSAKTKTADQLEQAMNYFDMTADLLEQAINHFKLYSTNKKIQEFCIKIFKLFDNVSQNLRYSELVDQIMDKAKVCFEQGKLEKAREELMKLPDVSYCKQIKEESLKQVDEAIQRNQTDEMIRKVIEKARRYLNEAKFNSARTEVQSIPDSSEELVKLKKELLKQINDEETKYKENQKINSLINSTLETAKECIGNGDYEGARRAVNKLPDSPGEIKELKKNYLKQINDVENELLSKIEALTKRINAKGISTARIFEIARLNFIEVDTSVKLYQLLNSIDQQLK